MVWRKVQGNTIKELWTNDIDKEIYMYGSRSKTTNWTYGPLRFFLEIRKVRIEPDGYRQTFPKGRIFVKSGLLKSEAKKIAEKYMSENK